MCCPDLTCSHLSVALQTFDLCCYIGDERAIYCDACKTGNSAGSPLAWIARRSHVFSTMAHVMARNQTSRDVSKYAQLNFGRLVDNVIDHLSCTTPHSASRFFMFGLFAVLDLWRYIGA